VADVPRLDHALLAERDRDEGAELDDLGPLKCSRSRAQSSSSTASGLQTRLLV
jgi:hypothetical protein